jgi:hypothetical protein
MPSSQMFCCLCGIQSDLQILAAAHSFNACDEALGLFALECQSSECNQFELYVDSWTCAMYIDIASKLKHSPSLIQQQ